MRKFVLRSMSVVIGIGLLGTTPASADPVTVTGGHVTAQMRGGTFTLSGDGFHLSGAPPFGYESGFWECTPCRASDRLNLSLSSSAFGRTISLRLEAGIRPQREREIRTNPETEKRTSWHSPGRFAGLRKVYFGKVDPQRFFLARI